MIMGSRLLGNGGIFLSLLLLPAALLAQSTTLTGIVVEATSGQPVPFATVEIRARHSGVQATEAGTFVLELPGQLAATDSVRVTSLGFAARMLPLPLPSPCRLALSPLPISLAEVVVRPSRSKPVRVGPSEKGEKFGFSNGKLAAQGSKGWQVARQFANVPPGSIQAVAFYVKPNRNCGKNTMSAPFRVRVYAADGPGGSPGTDLLTSSVITAATSSGWHEVDLVPFQLQIPTAGFFVAMEWLYTSPDFGCEYTTYVAETHEKKMAYNYGQAIGGYLDDAPALSWYLTAGYPWQPFKSRPPYPDKSNMNAAIQAIVQPY